MATLPLLPTVVVAALVASLGRDAQRPGYVLGLFELNSFVNGYE